MPRYRSVGESGTRASPPTPFVPAPLNSLTGALARGRDRNPHGPRRRPIAVARWRGRLSRAIEPDPPEVLKPRADPPRSRSRYRNCDRRSLLIDVEHRHERHWQLALQPVKLYLDPGDSKHHGARAPGVINNVSALSWCCASEPERHGPPADMVGGDGAEIAAIEAQSVIG